MGDELFSQGLLGSPQPSPLGQDAQRYEAFNDPLSAAAPPPPSATQPGCDGALQRANQLLADYAALLEPGKADEGSALILADAQQPLPTPAADTLWDERSEPTASTAARGLVVIDTAVAGWQDLVVSAPPEAEVLVWEANRDGVQQITEHLQLQQQLGATAYSNVAIVSENPIALGEAIQTKVNNLLLFTNASNTQPNVKLENAGTLVQEAIQSFRESLGNGVWRQLRPATLLLGLICHAEHVLATLLAHFQPCLADCCG